MQCPLSGFLLVCRKWIWTWKMQMKSFTCKFWPDGQMNGRTLAFLVLLSEPKIENQLMLNNESSLLWFGFRTDYYSLLPASVVQCPASSARSRGLGSSCWWATNQRPVSRSRDLCGPIRCQEWGSLTIGALHKCVTGQKFNWSANKQFLRFTKWWVAEYARSLHSVNLIYCVEKFEMLTRGLTFTYWSRPFYF